MIEQKDGQTLVDIKYLKVNLVNIVANSLLVLNFTDLYNKTMKIKEFEKGESCFGPILTVDGVDYQDLKREDVVEFINYMFREDINSNSLIRECFENCLDYLQAANVESSSDSCEQCGHWNYYAKYIVDDEDNN